MPENNSNSSNWQQFSNLGTPHQMQNSIILAITMLNDNLGSPSKRKKYRGQIFKFLGCELLQTIIQYSQAEFMEYMKKAATMSQPTQSRYHCALIADRTSDGKRYSKHDVTVCKQYTGSYGVIKTHGWYFLIATCGIDNPRIFFLGVGLHHPQDSGAEWEEGLGLLEPVLAMLKAAGIPETLYTFVADNKYMCTEAEKRLDDMEITYVGKAGGNKYETIEGIRDHLCEHAKRDWGNYHKFNSQYHAADQLVEYARLRCSSDENIYFQGKYKNETDQWRFIVTNWRAATGQWAFLRYLQRWWVEVTFKLLKQLCHWRDYHPKLDYKGERTKIHTAFVILLFSTLCKIRCQKRKFRKLTIGQVRRKLIDTYSEQEVMTIFMKALAD
jgi:hypothetical protein